VLTGYDKLGELSLWRRLDVRWRIVGDPVQCLPMVLLLPLRWPPLEDIRLRRVNLHARILAGAEEISLPGLLGLVFGDL
jgi:hypothetical protein